jgi:hypothetical protein
LNQTGYDFIINTGVNRQHHPSLRTTYWAACLYQNRYV